MREAVRPEFYVKIAIVLRGVVLLLLRVRVSRAFLRG
jgi:hypothetical protein